MSVLMLISDTKARVPSYTAIKANGVDQYITIPHGSDVAFDYTDAFSLELRIKFDASAIAVEKWVGVKIGGSPVRGFWIKKRSDDLLQFLIFSGENTGVSHISVIGTTVLESDRWYHLVFTYDGNGGQRDGLNIWVDAIRDRDDAAISHNSFVTNETTVNNTADISLLTNPVQDATNFTGAEITYLRIWDTELDSSEIIILYNEGLPFELDDTIAGCVREYLMENVVTLVDTVGGVDGSTNIDYTIETTFIEHHFQHRMTGDSHYYPMHQRASGDDVPFSGPQNPRLIYRDNVHTICATLKGGPGFHQQSVLFTFNHSTKQFSHTRGIDYATPYGVELHQHAAIIHDASGNILSANVDLAQSDIYIRRHSSLGANTLLARLGEGWTGGPLGDTGNTYTQWHKVGTDLFMITRQSFRYSFIYKSTDQGETWDAGHAIADSEDAIYQWMYNLPVDDPNKIRLIIIRRDQTVSLPGLSGGPFQAWYYLESTDGITFSNIDGSFSKNTVSSGVITKGELEAYFLFHDAADLTYWCGVEATCLLPDGTVCMVGDKDADEYQLVFWNGSSWTKRTIPNTLLPNGVGYRKTKAMYAIDNNTIEIFGFKEIGGFTQMVKIKTVDLGLNWTDEGVITTNPDIDHNYVEITYDPQNSDKVLVACTAYRSDGFNDIFIYEYQP